MTKKHWSVLVGLSLTAGLVSSLFLQKRGRVRQMPDSSLAKLYHGQWFFIDRQQNVQHTLKISPDLIISVDDKPLTYDLLELGPIKLVIRDQYGYQLIFYRQDNQVTDFYDEANDYRYQLDQKKDPN